MATTGGEVQQNLQRNVQDEAQELTTPFLHMPTAVRSLLPPSMLQSPGVPALRAPLSEHGGGSMFQSVRIPGIDMVGDGQSLVRDVGGMSFPVPARMGLSSSMEIPGMSLQDGGSSSTAVLQCLTSSEVRTLDDSESAFTFESMEAPSPQSGEPQPFSETLNSLMGAFPPRPGEDQLQSRLALLNDVGRAASSLSSDAARGSLSGVELVTKYAPVDGTQSASALTRNASRRSKSELSYAELLADPGPQTTTPKGAEPTPSTASDLSPSTPAQGSPSPAHDAKALPRKKTVKDEEAEDPPIPSVEEVQNMLDAQHKLLHSQLEDLQKLIAVQCTMTGINPLFQEMAVSVLGSKAVKKPEPSLVPEALRLLRDVYAFKDTVTKKEARELSILTGTTVEQILEFFSAQQSRAKRILQLAQDEASRNGLKTPVEHSQMPEPAAAIAAGDSFEKLLELMRSETSFTGQSRVLQIILNADYAPFLRTFLEKGGLRILGKWLTQAIAEEQTTLVREIMRVLFHLPMVHAAPAHVSPVFTTISKLRFYFASDVATSARTLIGKWNKLFSRKTEQPSAKKAEGGLQETIKSNSLAGPEKKKLKIEPAPIVNKPPPVPKPAPASNMPNLKGLDNSEKPPPSSLTVRRPIEDPVTAQATKKRLADLGKEKRKVLLVEEMGATGRRVRDGDARRSSTAGKSSRPLSADDIQKAKMRARLLQGAPNSKSKTQENATTTSSPSSRNALETAQPSVTPAQASSARSRPASQVHQNPPQAPQNLSQKPLQAPQNPPQPPQNLSQPPRTTQYQAPAVPSSQLEAPQLQAQAPQLQAQAPQLKAQALQAPQMPLQLPLQASQLQALQMHLQAPAFQQPSPQLVSAVEPFSDSGKDAESRNAMEVDTPRTGTKDGIANAEEDPCPLDAPPRLLIAALLKRAISWTVPPVASINPEWNVAAGEESKENEIQTLRVKREVEEFYPDPQSIPKDPKEPWEREHDYDDSLTLQVPITSEDGQDKDFPSQDVVQQQPLPSEVPAHDPQLLALLLRNPELVSELTSGKGLHALKSMSPDKPPAAPLPPPPPLPDSKQLQQPFVMPQQYQFGSQQPQHQQQQQFPSYGNAYRDAPRDYQQGQYYPQPGASSWEAYQGGSSFYKQQQQQQQQQTGYAGYAGMLPQQQPGASGGGGGGGGGSGGGGGVGNQPVWNVGNNRVSNNNPAFAHHHHQPVLQNNATPLDARYHQARPVNQGQQQQGWYHGMPQRPGW